MILLNIQDYILQNVDAYGYLGLFAICFLAATILPFSSDFLFAALIIMPQFDPWTCTFVATLGNWAGGMTNYFLGKLGNIEWIEKYLKIKEEKIIKMQTWIQGKGGALLAFFSFAPFVGDVMAVALGYMRANVYTVIVSMLIGKFSRYVVVMYAVKYGIHLFNS
ncbi:MAG: putative integral rane protein [Bacteroidetes bacterium]|jgi:membrane protein YqaA with SNARE-associated domain|nr:putative integral rane protein [Bacteroidota bacterium]